MSLRFRYLAADGHEVEIGTTGELVHAFLSGDLRDDTLLYDAEGGGWAPARNHSVFLTLGIPKAAAQTSFTLAESEPLDPGDALAEVLRARDDQRVPAKAMQGLTRFEGTLARNQTPRADSSSAPPAAAGKERARALSNDPSPVDYEALSSAWEGTRHKSLDWLEPTRSRRREVGVLGATTAALAGLGTALIIVVLVWDSIGRPAATASAVAQELPFSAVAPNSSGLPPGLPAGMSTAELQAFHDMAGEMQKLRSQHRVTRVPNVWLEGIYLSSAARYPEVREYWESYAGYVREMQETEGELYRRNFVARLERQGVATSAVSMLLARALRTFEADRARRETLYASMLEMAATAVELHDLLAAHEGEISFEPARGGVSRDPVVEAVADSPKLATQMNGLLDRMFLAIERAQGERVVPRTELPLALEQTLIPSEAAIR